MIGLIGTIAEAAASAAAVPDILRVAVEEVCRFLKCPVGHAYVPSQTSARELVSSGIWHLDDPKRFEPFRRASKHFPNIHRGLVGRALAAKKATLTPDIADKTVKFIYLDEAKAAGLTSGIVLPVMAGERVIAVLEFYATARAEKDSTLLAALDQIAHHVGQVAERVQARSAQQRLFDAVEGINDSIALYDKDERLLLCNRRYAAEFPTIAGVFRPGITFEDFIRALAKSGYFHHVDEDWIRERLRRFRAREDVEYAVPGADGRPEWRAVRHHLTENGETLVVLSDITTRKRAEAEKESAQQLLQTALDSMTDGVALFDKDERIVLFNESYARKILVPPDILKPGITFSEIVETLLEHGAYVGADKKWAEERIRKFRALAPAEMCLRDPDGSAHWYNVHLYRTRAGGTLLVRTDITQRKRAEAEKESAQQLLQTALDGITDGAALFDKDERLVLFNKGYVARSPELRKIVKPGVTFTEIVSHLVARGGYIGAGKDWVDERIRKFRALKPVELHLRDPDGGERWVYVQHHRTRDDGTFRVGTDITDRKRAEAERESARQLLQTALDGMTDGVALYDKDERLVLWNEHYIRNFLALRGILKLGVTFPEIVRAIAARQGYVGADEDFVAMRLGQFRALETAELQVRDSEGVHWLVARHYRTRDGGTLLVLTEITDRVLAMREVERARNAAERASETKTRFLASMSHELRTPLNAILGFAQMLELGAGKVAEAKNREYLSIVLKSGQHLLDLVTQILELASVESGVKEIVLQALTPARTARECLDMVREEAVRREVKIVDASDGLGPDVRFWGDPVRVRQVLLNLLSNAIKYNRPGGQVTLSYAPNGADRVRFTVADTGMGIPPDRHDEVFQPFQRLGREAGEIEGTGIGLALARQLVSRMGGTIEFASAPGQGSTFWFELPEVEAEAENEGEAATEERA